MAKVKPLSKEEIEAKKEAFEKQINESATKAKLGRRSPANEFLLEVKVLVKKALDNNISYSQIVKDIYTIYNFKIGVATLRTFAQTQLGVEKKTRVKSTAPTTEKNKVSLDTKEQKQGERIKADINDI